ncbi:MAG TPA: acireductone synthase [Coleofasciculaceae cyanobacterium]|jgi:enolase-phosphatase E1
MARYILMDIEGTTTDISFVHQVLFPYSAEHLPRFVQEYSTGHSGNPEVRAVLQSVKETIRMENKQGAETCEPNDEQAVETLLRWIREDRKHTALKTLQGLIWKAGYERGDYRGHVYDDVPAALEQWKKQGIDLGIYSSGSVQAQKLIFGYSTHGDLTPYFSHYFDTHVGGKKEAGSYLKIAEQLNLPPSDILFLSDMEDELDAAAQAGMQIMQLVRKEPVTSKYPTVSSFAELDPTEASILC